jgi:hypothetical protein
MSDSCASCAFSCVADGATFQPATKTVSKGSVRTCHERPPQVSPVGNSAWPVVTDGDWCGAWKAAPSPPDGPLA